MTTATRTKENDCDFPLFKTPSKNIYFKTKCTFFFLLVHSRLMSSGSINDLAFYSNSIKHLKYIGATSMSDLQKCSESMATPIRLNQTKFSTPGSFQRRRALGLVNYNSTQIPLNDDLSGLTNKHDESVILPAPAAKTALFHPEDDLPHQSKTTHCDEDTFDDLIPTDERVERMFNQTHGVNIFAYPGGIENTIRYQSPQCSRVDLSTLLDILN
jgi:hypothetical protein